MRRAVVAVIVAGCGRVDIGPETDIPPRFELTHSTFYGSTTGADTSFEAALGTATDLQGHVAETGAFDASTLAAVDLLVVGALGRTYSGDEAAALAAWVDDGGSVVIMCGFIPGDSPQTGSLVSALGIGIEPTLIDGPVTDFLPSTITAGLHDVTFKGGYALDLTGAYTPLARLGPAVVGGSAIFGRGRVVVWGDEWVSYDSEWATTDSPAFWADVFDWLRHRTN